jgi:hypothetical protein
MIRFGFVHFFKCQNAAILYRNEKSDGGTSQVPEKDVRMPMPPALMHIL